MLGDKDKKEDFSLFEQNYSNDPFKEEFFIFEHNKEDNRVFRLEINEKKKETKPEPEIMHEKEVKVENKPKISHSHTKEKRDYKIVVKDGFRQIIASVVILVLGFLILNWSAYYSIAKNKVSIWMGTKEESPLIELVEDNNQQAEAELIVSNSKTEIQAPVYPDLAIDISPVTNRIIIPRIDQNVPVVKVSSENLINRDWGALEKEIQSALKGGVVHYPGTAKPGEGGNVVITGHSSYFPWDPGRFKDVFALLHDVVIKDKIVIYYNQEKYVYEVSEIKIVLPKDIEVLQPTENERLTLITCTPVGTNLKRLIVIAKPVNGDENILR